jgi:hypothetical protein
LELQGGIHNDIWLQRSSEYACICWSGTMETKCDKHILLRYGSTPTPLNWRRSLVKHQRQTEDCENEMWTMERLNGVGRADGCIISAQPRPVVNLGRRTCQRINTNAMLHHQSKHQPQHFTRRKSVFDLSYVAVFLSPSVPFANVLPLHIGIKSRRG